MSTANAGIISLLRHYTTGTEEKKTKQNKSVIIHMITPLQTSQVTSIHHHCSLISNGDHDHGSVRFKHHSSLLPIRNDFTPHACADTLQNLILKRFPKCKGRKKEIKKKYVCLLTLLKKREPNWGREVFFS